MTNKQAQITINAIKFMLDHAQYSDDVEEALNMAINALTAQPSSSCVHENDQDLQPTCNKLATDCISRQAAIDAIENAFDRETILNRFVRKIAISAVRLLTSAQPDLSSYSDKLWHNAYERGRKEAAEEIIHCRECRWRNDQTGSTAWLPCRAIVTPSDFYCARAERREDGNG